MKLSWVEYFLVIENIIKMTSTSTISIQKLKLTLSKLWVVWGKFLIFLHFPFFITLDFCLINCRLFRTSIFWREYNNFPVPKKRKNKKTFSIKYRFFIFTTTTTTTTNGKHIEVYLWRFCKFLSYCLVAFPSSMEISHGKSFQLSNFHLSNYFGLKLHIFLFYFFCLKLHILELQIQVIMRHISIIFLNKKQTNIKWIKYQKQYPLDLLEVYQFGQG